jgi:hypothetical protein
MPLQELTHSYLRTPKNETGFQPEEPKWSFSNGDS